MATSDPPSKARWTDCCVSGSINISYKAVSWSGRVRRAARKNDSVRHAGAFAAPLASDPILTDRKSEGREVGGAVFAFR